MEPKLWSSAIPITLPRRQVSEDVSSQALRQGLLSGDVRLLLGLGVLWRLLRRVGRMIDVLLAVS